MDTLREHQFELLPSVDATEGFVFGIGAEVSLDENGFAPGADEWTGQDNQGTQGQTLFGRDVLTGPSWGWDLHVNRSDVDGALDTLGRFKTAWRAMHIRNTPGAQVALRYRIAGRTRRIYGRPRRFDAPPNNQILSGFVPVGVDFKAVDAYTYDDEISTATLTLGGGGSDPNSSGGLEFPVTFPLVSEPGEGNTSQVLVGGDAETHPIVRFNGPVSNPSLTADDWTLGLTMDIPDGQYVEVDTRVWANTVMLNGNASVAGKLGRRDRLDKVVLRPGRPSFVFRGYSSNGTATCQVSWANAHNSI